MSFNTITHPTTGVKYSIFSSPGRNLLKSYLRTYKSGGSSEPIKPKKHWFNTNKPVPGKEDYCQKEGVQKEGNPCCDKEGWKTAWKKYYITEKGETVVPDYAKKDMLNKMTKKCKQREERERDTSIGKFGWPTKKKLPLCTPNKPCIVEPFNKSGCALKKEDSIKGWKNIYDLSHYNKENTNIGHECKHLMGSYNEHYNTSADVEDVSEERGKKLKNEYERGSLRLLGDKGVTEKKSCPNVGPDAVIIKDENDEEKYNSIKDLVESEEMCYRNGILTELYGNNEMMPKFPSKTVPTEPKKPDSEEDWKRDKAKMNSARGQ